MRSAWLLMLPVLAACPAPPAAPPEPVLLAVDPAGAFSVSRAGVGLGTVRPAAIVSGTSVGFTAPSVVVADREDALGPAEETRLEEVIGGTRLVLVLRRYERFVTARLTAACDGACGAARIEGFSLAGVPTGEAPSAALVNGYSSWAPTYYATVQRDEPDELAAFTGNNQNALSSDARLSWWVGALVSRGPTLVAGAITADTWKTRVLTWRASDGVHVDLRLGGGGDSLPLTAEGVSSETLYFTGAASLEESLGGWAQAVATLSAVQSPPFVPIGWNSWNTLFEDVSQQRALANADAAIALGFGANNLQLDDGWEQAWGTWTANAKFPAGMDGFAAELAGKGLHAGVWMAPFFVDEATPVAVAHADWFTRDTQGRAIRHPDFFTGRTYLPIDATNAEARAWMVGEVQRLLDQGYRYLKLDFLYAGAWEGKRQGDVTSIQAFRLAMNEVMAAARARGAYVVACGAPLLPSAGVAHAIRTSNDIAARGSPYTFEWVKNMSRNVGARWFVNAFLANDPDTVLVRSLPDGVKRLQATTTLLAGRLFALGDDLTTGSDAAFLRQLASLPSIARAAQPGTGFVPLDLETPRSSSLSQAEALIDPEAYDVPSLWAARGTSEGTLVGVFNWSSNEQAFTLDAAQLGLSGNERAVELWRGTTLSQSAGGWTVTVPARDAAYVQLK